MDLPKPVRLAVVSGKGGTGKTTVATGLADALASGAFGTSAPVTFADCDVEAPNGHLFLSPRIDREHDVLVRRAQIDSEKCTGCGECFPSCRFAAIFPVPGSAAVMEDLCHGCGACVPRCPHQAIGEIEQVVGTVRVGSSGSIRTVEGRLSIGRDESPEVIRTVLEHLPEQGWVVLDGPPGTACPFTATLAGTDAVLLVAEPTPCGLHDLELAVEAVREAGLPHAVVLNRCGPGDAGIREYCDRLGIDVLVEIPHSRRLAQACAAGTLIGRTEPAVAPLLARAAFHLAAAVGDTVRGSQRVRRDRTSACSLAVTRTPATTDSLASPSPFVKPDQLGETELDDRQIGATCTTAAPAWTASQPSADTPVLTGARSMRLQELVVLSGKGGTGKTSITASLAHLARGTASQHASGPSADGADTTVGPGPVASCQPDEPLRLVMVDADVDASNLHLLLPGQLQGRWPFVAGRSATVDPERCESCGICLDSCRFDALHQPAEPCGPVRIDPVACEGCGACVDLCPNDAVSLVDDLTGHWGLSATDVGHLVHARLRPGRHNSGKLVSLVRGRAADLGRTESAELLISDGPPGTGCPATAAASGADHVLLVTEPTRGGLHDLGRVADLIARLGISAAVCINKVDLAPGTATELIEEIKRRGLPLLGTVRYDEAVRQAHLERTSVVVHAPDSNAAHDIRSLWTQVLRWIKKEDHP